MPSASASRWRSPRCAGGASTLAGWFAAVPALAWWLLLGNLFWVLAYDTEYAMVDRDDDLRIGIRTSAITLGRFDVAAVMASYAAFLALWAGLGLSHGAGWPFAAGDRGSRRSSPPGTTR